MLFTGSITLLTGKPLVQSKCKNIFVLKLNSTVMDNIIFAEGLRKTYQTKGNPVEAVKGVDLQVRRGEIFGFLGPNGAGKTTILRILSTLLLPDAGKSKVTGFDLLKDAKNVRRRIGYVSQAGGSDRDVTAIEDLILQGRLYGLNHADATKQAKILIETLDLACIAGRKSGTYSGGQKRRLDIALGMMHQPELLFLDEPTTGLDPQNRARLWDEVIRLRDQGISIFLTTHYMDEADHLSDQIAIMDQGRIVAQGSPGELKKQVAGDTVILGLEQNGYSMDLVMQLLGQQAYVKEASLELGRLRLYVENGETALPDILRLLDKGEIGLRSISLSQPSLNDVFLRQTGRSLTEETFA